VWYSSAAPCSSAAFVAVSAVVLPAMRQTFATVGRFSTQARIQEFLVEGDDIDEEKIGRGLGAAVGPQRGPGAEPLVGVMGAKPPTKVKLFSRVIQ
jgi:hypothetical protein